jgi:hypothetical protein
MSQGIPLLLREPCQASPRPPPPHLHPRIDPPPAPRAHLCSSFTPLAPLSPSGSLSGSQKMCIALTASPSSMAPNSTQWPCPMGEATTTVTCTCVGWRSQPRGKPAASSAALPSTLCPVSCWRSPAPPPFPTLPSPCLPACVRACLPASVGLCARLLRTCVPGASSPATGGSASSLRCPCLGQGAGVPRARRCGFYCPQCWRQPMPAAWTSRWPPTSPMYVLALCHRCRPCLVVHPASPPVAFALSRPALRVVPWSVAPCVVCLLLCALLLVLCCCVRSSWCHAVVCGPPGVVMLLCALLLVPCCAGV